MKSIQQVLVIDDEPDIRSVLEMTLSALAGWDVLTASTGMEGLRRAQSHRPDLILLDVMMPDMDGPETLLALGLLAETRGIPVIFMTAKAHFSVGRTITKPFDPARLIDQINRLLDDPESAPKDTAIPADVAQQLWALWHRYKPDTLSKVEVLHRAATHLQAGTLSPDLRRLAGSHAHMLAGTAGLFGFTRAAEPAELLREVFEDYAEIADGTNLVELVEHVRREFGDGDTCLHDA